MLLCMMSTSFFMHSKCKKRAEKLRKKKEREMQERKIGKVTGTEDIYIYNEYIMPRQGEDREEVQPGRKLGIDKVK